MSRFQAQTNAVLDRELSHVSKKLGLTASQKADLLREITALALWVIRQVESGREIAARRGSEVELLMHPVLDRLREQHASMSIQKITLSDSEAERLVAAMERGFESTPALRKALVHLANPERRPPKLTWKTRIE